MEVAGTLPGGGKDSQTIRVSGLVPFLVMKAIALNERLKPKDAWDIYFVISKYEGGAQAIADEFRPLLGRGLIQEAIANLQKHFSSVEHIGPKLVSDFEEVDDREEIARIRRDAYEKINLFLASL